MPTQAINSMSRTCQLLQRGFGMVQGAITTLGITPVALIDGVPYFDDAQIEQLRRHFDGEVKVRVANRED